MDISKLRDRLPAVIFNQLPEIVDIYGINTRSRLIHFMAQCHHESAGFKEMIENLNYSGIVLNANFCSHFKGREEALSFSKQPYRIANRIYADRMGNGNESSGDGWKYRGKGCIQITGKANTETFFKSVGIDAASDPMLIVSDYPLISAAWFWEKHNLNQLADSANYNAVKAITKVINGGVNGLEDRIKWFDYYSTLVSE